MLQIKKYKICFIICIKNDIEYQECLLYINNLIIPSDYQIDVIAVEETPNIATSYNEALKSSNAKYKVYLHSDIFIINKNFIDNIIEIFCENPSVGMIGVVGTKILPVNGDLSESKFLYGKIFDNTDGKMSLSIFGDVSALYEEVQVIDGMIMITQYDILWREDIFVGRYFYEISQSIECINLGYKVVIANQLEPWCIHDCGKLDYKASWNDLKNIFFGQYTNIIVDYLINNVEKERSSYDESVIEWRNYYVDKTNDKNHVKELDEHLLKKFNLTSVKVNELFDFDKIYALQILLSNRKQFYKLLHNAKSDISTKNYEQAARWCYKAAQYASENHPGFYRCIEIEQILIECAKNLPDTNKKVNLFNNGSDNNKRKVLHVISEGYSTGGHTRLVKNWIKSDVGSIHSLITTWQITSTPEWLIDEVEKSGGWTRSLENITDFVEQGSELRKIAYEWADIVVLHTHMFDVVPVMAFGIEGGPPILFMNHADHVFWVGTSIIDNLVNFREAGKELSIRRRGVLKNSIFPLPLSLQLNKYEDKYKIKGKLGIKTDSVVLLTIATPYKFKSFGKYTYIDILKKVLLDNEKAIAIVVGPSCEGIWKKAYEETNGRLIPMGRQDDIGEFYYISDIYVDSYMIGSQTSVLEAGISGLPIASLENYNNKSLSFNDISYTDFHVEFNKFEEYIDYINKLIRNKDYRKNQGWIVSNKILEDHVYRCNAYLNVIYNALENEKHEVNLSNGFEDRFDSEDLTLALFQYNN